MVSTRKNLYLLRHCVTTDSEHGINGSRTDTPLSENGLKMAHDIVVELLNNKYDLIIVSPLKRTVQTIIPFVNSLHDKPDIIVEPLSLERDLGIFTNTITGDGKIKAVRIASGKNRVEWLPERGESIIMVYKRAAKVLEKLKDRRETNILICGHQVFLRCLELIILNRPIDDENYYSTNPPLLSFSEIRKYEIY